ncbi:MAG: carbamoyltransferase HypF [Desulfotalea sp.]
MDTLTKELIIQDGLEGVEIFIRGTVQGVGFRPFIYNLAHKHNLQGSVSNTGEGVAIHTSCSSEALDLFIKAIQTEAPPLSRIRSIKSKNAKPPELEGFNIIMSTGNSSADAAIPPDIALCDDCFKEMNEPDDPRFAYPFINCTNCGPRFTIVEKIPYDRPFTSMKVFPMCEKCQGDYEDPSNRRFHAQPNACPVCGPKLSWHDKEGKDITTDALGQCASALEENKVIAIRGLGGFHLCCNGLSGLAIATLRTRKNRPDKPLAIMVPNIEVAKKYCHMNKKEEHLLLSIEHPIVLLRQKELVLPANLAPKISEIGIMLPYTPQQHLLFKKANCPEVLVMTSGNASGTPICTGNMEAIERLSHLADNYLLHNREIVTRIDDSVTRVTASEPLILRRARGYVPSPIVGTWKLPASIGVGAGLKTTFCLGKNNNLYTSQHIGDLANVETYDFFVESIEHLKDVFQIKPEIVICDLHPDYMSTRYAKELGLPLYQVQHHHAHAVAVMAEHGLDEDVIAIILDGTGFGTDGTLWGGEILKTSLTSLQRLGHLKHLSLPGGDKAASQPWRVAMSALHQLEVAGKKRVLPTSLRNIDKEKRDVISAMLQGNFNCPKTSSCGRLFDAVSSLLGICHEMSYEGQAAMELEDQARRVLRENWQESIFQTSAGDAPFILDEEDRKWEIDSLVLIENVLDSIESGMETGKIALNFHLALIRSLTALVLKITAETGIKKVVLSGGCMQNSIMLEGLRHSITKNNIQVFTGENIPINDGGISLGQTVIGGLQHVSRNSHESN